MLDPVRNFAKVTVSQGYDSTATQITLVTGDGAKLPDPATEGAFNLVWYNDTDYKDPADDPYVEIVRVTAKSGDTLTIQRGQEGTSAQNHNLSGKTYKMVLSLTKKTKDDIDSQFAIAVTKTNLGTSYILTGLDANKPTAGIEGRLYYATDTGKLYRDNGTSWDYLEDLNKITKPSGAVQGAILYYDGNNWVVLPPGTAGQFLKTQGAGANPVWNAIPIEDTRNFLIASNNLRNSNDSEKSTASTVYVKVKETQIGDAYGTLRIYFELKSSTGGKTVYAKIYRNGQPVGTERGTTYTYYQGYTEDISGWSPNDYIQIYARSTETYVYAYVQNFRIFCDSDYKRIWKIGNTELSSENYLKSTVLSTIPSFTNTLT
jgi:hypothetical protein